MEWFVVMAVVVTWMVLAFATLRRIDKLEDRTRDLRDEVDKLRYEVERQHM